MKIVTASLAALAMTVAGTSSSFAQSPPPPDAEPGKSLLAITQFPPEAVVRLMVTSPAFQSGGDIPFENTQYRGNKFPGLSWTAGPAETITYVVIMQDGDAMVRGAPILHWSMFDIPATVTSLAAGMTTPPAGETSVAAGLTKPPEGAKFGPNIRGASQPYMGPRTPAGPKHRYHLQVFALNAKLLLGPTATYDELMAAMKLHVVGSGELIGLGQIDPNAPPRPPAPR